MKPPPTPPPVVSLDEQARHDQHIRAGLIFGLIAYGWWGFVAAYFKVLAERGVPALDVVSHRIVWSVVFLAILIFFAKRSEELKRTLRSRSSMLWLLGSTLMIGVNWYLFIYAVETQRTLSASLGYYINPLVSVLLGVIFIRERLRSAQVLAVAIASAGVINQIIAVGVFPWIAISLAITFGFYGLLRKQAPISPLIGLTVECVILFPFAAGMIAWRVFSTGDSHQWSSLSTYSLLMLAGVVTAIPLLCFAAAARRLRLSTMGFLQYVSPTLQLLLAVLAFGEPFGRAHLVTFALIWIACAVFSFDSIVAYRNRSARRAPVPAD